jgi:hypothetical protein
LVSPWVLPLVGNDAHSAVASVSGQPEMATSFDVYQCILSDTDSASPSPVLTIVQFRGGVVPKRAVDLSNDVAEWVKVCGFTDVVVLAGADASRRMDTQLLSQFSGHQQLYYTVTDGYTLHQNVTETLDFRMLDEVECISNHALVQLFSYTLHSLQPLSIKTAKISPNCPQAAVWPICSSRILNDKAFLQWYYFHL